MSWNWPEGWATARYPIGSQSCIDIFTGSRHAFAMDMLDPNAGIPLYRQLANWLEGRIRRGELRPGDKIPSEPQLASRFGLGRPTVRQATDWLMRRGLVERRRGAGTFVCEAPGRVDLFSLTGSSAAFEERGIRVERRWIGDVLGPVLPDIYLPFPGAEAGHALRLSVRAEEPILLEEFYFWRPHFPELDVQLRLSHAVSTLLRQRYGRIPDRARQDFRVIGTSPEYAQLLRWDPKVPLLQVTRELHFPGLGPAVFVRIWCRTDRFSFSQTITRGEDAHVPPGFP